MNENKEKLVIVLSRKYSTGLSVVRSLGAAGYTVDLVSSAYKEGYSAIAASSKYVRHSNEVVSLKDKAGQDEGLLEEILKHAGKTKDKPILYPTDDYTTFIVDANRSLLDKHFIMPTIVDAKDGSLTHLKDRVTQGRMARNVGFITPLEWIISLDGQIIIPDDMVYPCYCKPMERTLKYRQEVAVCDDEMELMRHLIELRSKNAERSIVVQEYLGIESEIDISGVCNDQEIIIPAIIKKTEVGQYEKGITLAGKVVPLDEIGEIKDKIIKMMKEFHYIGMFNMELYVVGEKIYFNKINLRIGEPNYAYFMSGVNLPDLFVKKILGQECSKEEEQVKEFGKNFIYEKVAWDDYIAGFMTKKELDECFALADFTLLNNDDDPMPGKLFMKNIQRKALRKKIKRGLRAVKKVVYPPLRQVKHVVLGYPQTKKKNQRDPNAQKPRVIVAGRNYCSNLCTARALGTAGYEVEILRIFQAKPRRKNLMKMLKPDAYSKYVKAYHVCVTRGRNRRIIDRLIKMADPDRKMLLLAADDLVANTVDDYLDELKEYYIVPNVNSKAGEIDRLMSKEVQKVMAKDFGLPVLNSCMIRTVNGEFEIPDTVNYPCFIKPNISKNGSKTKMKRIDSEEELRETLTEYSLKKDVEMLVEDFVDIGYEYSILGVSTKDGAIGPGFFRAIEGGHAGRRGVALCGEVVPCSQRQELINDILRFIESLNYEGLFDVDLIEAKDGTMYFVELNLRFGGSGYSITSSGVNLPGMFADYMLLGKPIDLNCKLENTGKVFINEKIMIEEYTQDFLTWADIKKKMKEVNIHFIKNDVDKRPYRHFKRFYFIAGLRRKLYIMKNKDNVQ